MRYLYGDSTESDLGFNYLALLRQAIDCAVRLLQYKAERATAMEVLQEQQRFAAVEVEALEHMLEQVKAGFSAVASATTPAGRVAAAMVEAAEKSAAHEIGALHDGLAAEVERDAEEDRLQRQQLVPVIEKLLASGGEDAARDAAVVALATALRVGGSPLALDGTPLVEHPAPHVIAQRLIDAIAPVVQEIATRSRSADELVLRRMVADDRREEIFVQVKDLVSKLDELPDDERQLFAPLGFVKAGIPARRGPPPPPPVGTSARHRSRTVELENAQEVVDALLAADGAETAAATEPTIEVSAEPSLDAAIDAALDGLKPGNAVVDVAGEIAASEAEAAKAERRPRPRALIIESTEMVPLPKPDGLA